MSLRWKLVYLALIAVGVGVGIEYGALQASVCFILLFASCAFTIDFE